jgi:hypothetical protein
MPIARRLSTGPRTSVGKARQAEAIRAYILAHRAKKRAEDAQLRQAGPRSRHVVPLMSVPHVEIEICEVIEHLNKALMTARNRPHPRVRHAGHEFVQTP